MNKIKFILLTAGLVLAMAFALSCSSPSVDVPGTDGSSSSEIFSEQSSSSVPARNCDEGYDTEVEFCYSDDKVYPLCGTGSSGMYNPTVTGCCNGVRFTLATEACCDNNTVYNKSTHGCTNNTVLPKCRNDFYDPATHFCSSNNQIYEKCSGATFEPEREACINNVLLTRCGDDFYATETHFCSGNQIYKKCSGATFEPEREACINNVLLTRCGDDFYATETHFCSGGQIYKKCNGAIFNPEIGDMCINDVLMAECGDDFYATETHFCSGGQIYKKCNGAIFNPEINKCENSVLLTRCGDKGDFYDPETHFCFAGLVKAYYFDNRDNKKYKTAVIGTQTWMAENLNYEVEGSKCYDNNPANCAKYGRLYDWATAMEACPAGWYLPSQDEWNTLGNNASKLKATSGWNSNGNGTDEYGFSALPGGYGSSIGSFYNVGNYGYWWGASENSSNGAYYRHMYYNFVDASWDYYGKSNLLSVRCLQD